MELKIIEMPRLEVYGVSQQYDGEDYRNREELRHKMWDEAEDDVPGKLCEAKWNQPGSKAMDGLWYGIWQDGRYMIAREKANLPHPEQWEKATIPAGTYACAKSAPGTLAWEELPKLFQELAECWLPTSGYCRRGGDDLLIELEHLWTDKEERREKRFYEVLIPVERK